MGKGNRARGGRSKLPPVVIRVCAGLAAYYRHATDDVHFPDEVTLAMSTERSSPPRVIAGGPITEYEPCTRHGLFLGFVLASEREGRRLELIELGRRVVRGEVVTSGDATAN